MKNFRSLVVLITGIFLSFTALAAESLSVLLQKGIYAEETEGNLDSAIKIYEQIAAEMAANRPLAAQALYRLAVCYQKQGKKEQAVKLLNELVQQSPADGTIAKKARETLMELGVMPAAAITPRRVPFPASVSRFKAISNDARFVAYIPTDSFDLAVCELSTGKTWKVASASQEKEIWNASFSPDSQSVAYNLGGSAIHTTRIDGTVTAKLSTAGAHQEELHVEGWSADGRQLLLTAVSWPPEGITYVSVALDAKIGARTDVRQWAQFKNWRTLGHWSTSPTGRYVAWRTWHFPKKIGVVALQSGRDEMIVGADAERVLGWATDARLYFLKSRAGSLDRNARQNADLWSIRLEEGKAAAEPELVFPNLGDVWGLGVTSNGNIYYAPAKKSKTDSTELWVLEMPKMKIPDGIQRTKIPPDEIVASDNSILDKRLGLALTYPDRWTIGNAYREGPHQTVNWILLRDDKFRTAELGINYRANPNSDAKTPEDESNDRPLLRKVNAELPKPATPREVDAWLDRLAQLQMANKVPPATHSFFANFRVRPETVALRSIGALRARSYVADFARNGKENDWAVYHTTLYSPRVIADFRLIATANDLAALRPLWDTMIETVQVR